MSQQPFPPAALRGAVDLSALARPKAPASGQGPTPGGAPAAGAAGAGTGQGAVLVGTDESFQDIVSSSLRYPVIVVLWSARLPESGDFVTIMGGLARANEGRFQVVSVDVDTNPGLQRALQVQQVPVTIALLQGRPVPLFVGPLLPQEAQPILDELLQLAVQNGVTGRAPLAEAAPDGAPDASEPAAEPELPPLIARAYDAIDAGDLDGAIEAYEQALKDSPADLEAKVGLAQVRLMKRTEDVDAAMARAAAASDPADVPAQLLVADLDLLGGHISDAFRRLVDLVRVTAGDERNAARERLLELFEIVGPTDEVTAARRALMSALF